MRCFPFQSAMYGVILIGIFSFMGFEFQTASATAIVEISSGTSVPGCEETNSCFVPYSITVNEGEIVHWDNQDSAAHTVTSGDPADANSLATVFDSGLLLAGTIFSHTFEEAGTVDYFCIVHPWMKGQVVVKGTSNSPTSSSTSTSPTPPTIPSDTDITIPIGSSSPDANSNFSPDAYGAIEGDNVTWFNQDSAAHTVTSGSPTGGPDGKFDSGIIMQGASFSHKFSEAGSYPYFCIVHPWKSGTIIVLPSISKEELLDEPPKISEPLELLPVDVSSSFSLIIKNVVSEITDKGIILVTGTLENTRNFALNNIQIQVNFYDKNNKLIETITGAPNQATILANSQGTFSIVSTFAHQNVANVQVNVLGFTSTSDPISNPSSYPISSAPSGTDITITSGTSVPGCEESNSCYSPYSLKTSVGKTTTWYNADSAAHTVTSGVVSDANSIGKVFDSSLVLAGDIFSHKFTSSGTYPYFCIVHPWMIGNVEVSGSSKSSSNYSSQIKTPIIISTDKQSYNKGDVIDISGQVRSILRGYSVTVSIISPDGDIMTLSQLDVDKYLKFSVGISTDGKAWEKSGEYTVKAIYGTEFRMDETTFKFNAGKTDTKPKSTSTSTFIASASTGEIDEPIIVFTDGSSYREGDDIRFFGAVQNIISNNQVSIQVTNPEGSLIGEGSLYVDASKRFNGKLITTDEKYWDTSGTYQIKATYGSNVAKTTFVFNDCGPSNSFNIWSGNMIKPTTKICTKILTDISLDKISSSVFAGDKVVFQGTLSSNGEPISNVPIQIKELDLVEGISEVLATGSTNSEGKFSIPWSVSAAKLEFDTEFLIYAKFDGIDDYKNAVSKEQKVLVLKNSGDISFTKSLPSKVEYGDIVKIEGKLTLNKGSPNGAIVYIKDKDYFFDDLLATAIADENGRFSTYWRATFVDNDGADIYAVFEGNDEFYRQTTCDDGPTYSFGGLCNKTHKLTITERTSPIIDTYDYDGSEFMKLVYSLPFKENPKVLIVTTPDSYSKVKGHIFPVIEGIKMWTLQLEKQYGGNWDIEYKVLPQGSLFTNYDADIVVNLVTRNEYTDCFVDIYGLAAMKPSLSNGPIQTVVCSSSQDYTRDNAGVSSTAAHEFIHAVGLGHTFNKKWDMMCSVENDIETCPNGTYGKSKTPSNLNYAAVVKMYGTDGFQLPNYDVWTGSFEGTKFTVDDYLNGEHLQ